MADIQRADPVRILALVGSNRKSGNARRMVDMVREGLEREAAWAGVRLEVETVHLGHWKVQPCRGCRTCLDLGGGQVSA